MVLVLITVFFMIYCFRNFGRGLLISKKDKVVGAKRPFEIDEDPEETVPAIPLEASYYGDDGASQRLMAVPALKKIQETYIDKSKNGSLHFEKNSEKQSSTRQPLGAGVGPNPGAGSSPLSVSSDQTVYHDKMELE